VTDKPI
jgi:hypothetical protein